MKGDYEYALVNLVGIMGGFTFPGVLALIFSIYFSVKNCEWIKKRKEKGKSIIANLLLMILFPLFGIAGTIWIIVCAFYAFFSAVSYI